METSDNVGERVRNVAVGDHVIFVDQKGRELNALVNVVWGKAVYPHDGAGPTINLVIIDPNEGADDTYGRQRKCETSVPHDKNTTAPGYFWRAAA